MANQSAPASANDASSNFMVRTIFSCDTLFITLLLISAFIAPHAPFAADDFSFDFGETGTIPHPPLNRASLEVREHIQAEIQTWKKAIDDPKANSVHKSVAYGRLTRVYHAYQFFDAALACYAQADSLVPDSYPRLYLMGLVEIKMGRLEEARETIGQSIFLLKGQKSAPRMVMIAAFCTAGDTALKLQKLGEAHRYFKMATELAPKYPFAWYGLAQVVLQLGRDREAASYLENVLALTPRSKLIRDSLLPIYHRLDEPAKIQSLQLMHQDRLLSGMIAFVDPIYDQMVRPLNQSIANLTRMANSLSDNGNYEGAKLVIQKARNADPEHPLLLSSLGKIAIGERRWNDAEKAFETILEKQSSSFDEQYNSHQNLGIVGMNQGDFQKAQSCFEKCLSLDSNNSKSHFWLGAALNYQNQFTKALASFETAIAINHNSMEAWIGKARMLCRLNRPTECLKTLETIAESFPDSTLISLQLGQFLAAGPDKDLRNGERAITLLQPMFDAAKSVKRGIALAMALAEAGRFEEAVHIQNWVLVQLQRTGNTEIVRSLNDSLNRYQAKQVPLKPWPDWDRFPIIRSQRPVIENP